MLYEQGLAFRFLLTIIKDKENQFDKNTVVPKLPDG